MPRLTSRVFTDLAIWMTGFGIVIGLIFPPFCLLFGLPSSTILSPGFFATTLAAGLAVGAVNYFLARIVVGSRIRLLADRMNTVETRLGEAVFTHDWTGCDPATCALPVDFERRSRGRCVCIQQPDRHACSKPRSGILDADVRPRTLEPL